MLTCQRCGRCYDMEKTNVIDRLGLTGFRYDSLESPDGHPPDDGQLLAGRARRRPSATSGRGRQETDMLPRSRKNVPPVALGLSLQQRRLQRLRHRDPQHPDAVLRRRAVRHQARRLAAPRRRHAAVGRRHPADPAPGQEGLRGHARAQAGLRHRLLRRRRRLLVRHLQRHRRRGHGRAGRITTSPAARRGPRRSSSASPWPSAWSTRRPRPWSSSRSSSRSTCTSGTRPGKSATSSTRS